MNDHSGYSITYSTIREQFWIDMFRYACDKGCQIDDCTSLADATLAEFDKRFTEQEADDDATRDTN